MPATERFLANWTSQARKGVLELLVMATLEKREFYGYELVEHVAQRAGLQMSDGTLYAILSRLDAEGLLTTRWDAPSRGPARKYYALTQHGIETLGAMRLEWRNIVRSITKADSR